MPRAPSWVWLCGRLVPLERARVSVLDRGFLYGDAVFETIRFYGGRPFRWELHRRRLLRSLARFAIARPDDDLLAAASRVLARNRLSDAAVRVTVTRGEGEGLLPPRRLRPTVLITARPIPAELADLRRVGIAVVTVRGGGAGVAGGHKAVAYLPSIDARMQAARRGADDAVFLAADGTVSEATTANLFAVGRGRLVTPPLEAGCLPGITRAVVLSEARRAGLAVRVAALSSAELRRADEVFLSASIAEIVPVVRVDGRRVGEGRPGPITRLLQERYARAVSRSLARRTGGARRAGGSARAR